MKKLFYKILIGLFLIGIIIPDNLVAQQLPGFIFYNQVAGLYNPSAIPSEYSKHQHNLIVGATVRRQGTKISSAPKTQAIKAEYISDYGGTFNFLYGGYILNDQAGPIRTTGIYGRIASIMSKYSSEVGGFSGGIQLGMTQYSVNTAELQERYPDDILTQMNPHSVRPSLSVGVSYYNKITSQGIFDNSYINAGISVAQIGFSKHKFSDELQEFNIYTDPHIYFYGKMFKKFSLNAIEINSWVKYIPNAPINADIHLLYYINSTFWFEMGANSSGIGHAGIGVQFKNFFNSDDNLLQLNYAYNPSWIKFGNIFGDTHELTLKYSLRRN